MEELADAVREHMDKVKPLIVMKSEDEEHCVELMKDEMDDFVEAFVQDDDFFKEIPDKLVKSLKIEHDPIYRDAYVNTHFFLFFF